MSSITALRERLPAPFLALALLTLGATQLRSQCQLAWQPGTPLDSLSGHVRSLESLPSGDLVAGGWFLEAGSVVANHLARWDGAAWHSFGVGLNDNVYDIEVAANGDLIVCGKFTMAGGVSANHVARWDGTAWSPLGQGLDDIVNCIEILPNGNVLAGGRFQASGGTTARLVAEWDGSSWSQMGGGIVWGSGGGGVHEMVYRPNGEVVVTGTFNNAGGVAVEGLARWNGSSWAGFPFTPVATQSIAVAPNGDVAISGLLDVTGTRIGVWDGVSLTPIATVTQPGGIGSVLEYADNGDLYVATPLQGGSPPVMKWDGAAWSQVGSGVEVPAATLHWLPAGQIMVGGGGLTELSSNARSLATFDGTNWNVWGSPSSSIGDFATGNGVVYAGGSPGVTLPSSVSRYNGAQWVSVGPPLLGFAHTVIPLAGGHLMVGHYDDLGMQQVLLWDGAAWSSISAGLTSTVRRGLQAPDGTVYVGLFSAAPTEPAVVSWDGASWQEVGAGLSGVTWAMAWLPNGDLLVAGNLQLNGVPVPHVMRWDGVSWTTFGAALPSQVNALIVAPDGTVVVSVGSYATTFTPTVMSGSGSSWTPLGGGFDNLVVGLERLPNGDLLANGRFMNVAGVPAGGLARWDGSTWQSIGTGANASVEKVGVSDSGTLFVAGPFTRVDGIPSTAFGAATTTCPAPVQSFGSGCLGPVGPLALTAVDSPWSGGEFRTRTFGMPSNAVAISAVGSASTNVPLASLVPQSLAGCSLLTSSDVLDLVVPTGGVADVSVAVPAAASLVGMTFYQQVVAIELDANLNILTVSSSNGLAATIGFF